MDTIYPAEMDTLGILYTDKKSFGFLIFPAYIPAGLAGKLTMKNLYHIKHLTGNTANG
jgi:hypothetical protein